MPTVSTATTVCPKQSPWGPVQSHREHLPGIHGCYTPGHGGFWLAPDRAEALRTIVQSFAPDWVPFTRSWQWLEEDCDWMVVAIAFPAAFTPTDVTNAIQAIRTRSYYKAVPRLLELFWQAPAGRAATDRAVEPEPAELIGYAY